MPKFYIYCMNSIITHILEPQTCSESDYIIFKSRLNCKVSHVLKVALVTYMTQYAIVWATMIAWVIMRNFKIQYLLIIY